MSYADFVALNYKPKKSDLICLFYIEPFQVSMKEAAGAVAAESSVGTWTEVTTETKRIAKMRAKVFEIKNNYIKVAYPYELFERGNMPEILSSIAGNIFGMKIVKNLRLEDIKFPENIIKSFKGPAFGINGIRKLLNIKDRPLVGTIVKPKLGLNPKEHAKVAYESWVGGCDIVKDDENLSSQDFNKFRERVMCTLIAKDKAEKETGEKKAYLANITAETEEMLDRANFVKHNKGNYLMVDIINMGWSALQTVRKHNFKLPLHAHRAGYAALARNKMHGISMLAIAKIARMIGVDSMHIGTAVGKMEGPAKEISEIEEEIELSLIKKNEASHILEQKWYNLKPVMAVCSGGLYPSLVPSLIKMFGKNIICQAGGGVHGHKLGTKAGATAMRQAVEAALKGVSLREYAKNHKELYIALRQWD
ncbi:MAG: type III ribulose-bisphosphate carboxylase [Nanoarchaeota archaeon]